MRVFSLGGIFALNGPICRYQMGGEELIILLLFVPNRTTRREFDIEINGVKKKHKKKTRKKKKILGMDGQLVHNG